MVRTEYLAMKTDGISAETLQSDLKDLGLAAKKLSIDAMKLGGLAFGTAFLQWVAFIAAGYLMLLEDATEYKPNILTSLLVPYMFLTLPSVLFNFLRGNYGRWVALISISFQLFFPEYSPNWPGKNGSLLLVVVVAPSLVGESLRGHWIGCVICIFIACYHLEEQIRASGGFKQSFTTLDGLGHTIGILLMFVYPIWALVLFFV